MEINEIKKRMLKYTDFYGGDISDTDAIRNAKTRKELRKILNSHIYFLELQALDAQAHTEEFISTLGLNILD